MAQGIANRPGTADQLFHFFLTPEALEPAGMKRGQGVIIPTNGAANLDVIGVNPPGGVVSRGDAAGNPILKPV